MKDDTTTIAQLKKVMHEMVAEREWQPFHNPKNLSMSIAIEAAELMEKFQFATNQESIEIARENKEEVSYELVDVLSYILSFANACDIDVVTAFEAKMALNRKKYPVELAKGSYLKYTKLKKK